jgi:hypothetical protein
MSVGPVWPERGPYEVTEGIYPGSPSSRNFLMISHDFMSGHFIGEWFESFPQPMNLIRQPCLAVDAQYCFSFLIYLFLNYDPHPDPQETTASGRGGMCGRVTGMSPHMGVRQGTTGFAHGAPFLHKFCLDSSYRNWVSLVQKFDTLSTIILLDRFNGERREEKHTPLWHHQF